MHYDPIKKTVGEFFNKSPFLRKTFYTLLDLLLLRAWHVHREIRKWKKESPKNPHILDAGFGFGQYTYFMKKVFPSACICGVDVKEDQVSECNQFFRAIKKENVVFKVADLLEYKQPDTYDLCLCVDVLEHIEDDVTVMSNICKSLKEGGMLLVSTPSDQGGSDVHEDSDTSFIEEHARDGYNMDEIKEKLRKAGFSKVKAHYSYGAPGKISWRLSMKYPMQLLNVSKLFLIILPFYYIITYPISFILNFLDVKTAHRTGTGLIVKAWR